MDRSETEKEEEDDWTDADYRRAGVIRAVDFRRFGAMRAFENQLLNNAFNGVSNSHMMSREEYADLIMESIRDDLPNPEALNKKKKMESEAEAEKMKKLIDDLVREDPEENTTVEGLHEIYEKYGIEASDAVAKARCERLDAARAKARLEAAAKAVAPNDCEEVKTDN